MGECIYKVTAYVSSGFAAFTRGELVDFGLDADSISKTYILLDKRENEFKQSLIDFFKDHNYAEIKDPNRKSGTYYFNAVEGVDKDGNKVLYAGEFGEPLDDIEFTYCADYVPSQLPATILLQRNDRGFYSRSSTLRPDIWGFCSRGDGKLFFVDKRYMRGICEGFAVIDKVLLEKENYGFVKVHMLKMETPNAKDLADFIASIGIVVELNSNVEFYKRDSIGGYAIIGGQFLVYKAEDGNMHMHDLEEGKDAGSVFRRGNPQVQLVSSFLEKIQK